MSESVDIVCPHCKAELILSKGKSGLKVGVAKAPDPKRRPDSEGSSILDEIFGEDE